MQISFENHLISLNQTAAVLLASAACELFPGVLLVGGEGGKSRFYYDFIFPFEFQENFLNLLEERMRLIVREKRGVRALEMMPSNAASLMKHRGQMIIAEKLSTLDRALVQMCEMGEFIDYCPLAFQEDLNIPSLKLFESFPLDITDRKIIRIVGAAALEKDTLKALAKQPPYSSLSHLRLAREMRLFEPMGEDSLWFWRSKAEICKQQLVSWWQQECAKQNFSLISTPISERGEDSIQQAHREYFLRCQEPKVAETTWMASQGPADPTQGLLATQTFFTDRAHIFCAEEKLLQESISSLHFILKIPKILGFEFEIVLSVSSAGAQKAKAKAKALFQQMMEKEALDYAIAKDEQMGTLARIEVHLFDALGRRWPGPFLSIPEAGMPTGKGCMLTRSSFGSMERLLALLLEKREGWLPLWLAPEQVRILLVNNKAEPYANEVLQTLKAQKIRATVESGEEKLKAQLYRAILEKVPYIILLGEREERAKSLTVRFGAETKEQNFSLEEFCMRLKVEIGSGTSESENK